MKRNYGRAIFLSNKSVGCRGKKMWLLFYWNYYNYDYNSNIFEIMDWKYFDILNSQENPNN